MANISRMLECALFSHVLLFESLLLSITVMIFFFFFFDLQLRGLLSYAGTSFRR